MTGRSRTSVTLLALTAMREMRAKGASLMAIGDAVRAKGFDRVARSKKQLIETIETLRVRGIRSRSLTEALDRTTAQERLVFHMLGALAKLERSLIRERTQAGLAAARRTGRTGGRPPKFKDEDHLGEVVLDAACAWKLGSLAFKLLAGASKVRDHESLATFLAVTERLQAKIERNSDQWLRSEFGSDLAKQADALAAIAALDDIFSKCLPDGLSVAQANLNPDRIADLVVAKAGQADASFRERTFGGRLLHCLIQRTCEEAKRDHYFAAATHIPVPEILLNRTNQLVTSEPAMQQQIAELKAVFGPQIAATATEYRLPREAVDQLLLTTIGLAEVEQAAIPTAFDELARRFAMMRDTLQEQRNDDPEIATLKKQANAALAVLNLDTTEGLLGLIRTRRRALSANAALAVLNLGATEGLLMSIRTQQRALSERRRREKARADLIATLKDEAGTCLQQADAALLRFDVTMALGFSRDGIAVLAETPPPTRWRYMFQVIDSLSKFGDRAGSNEALLASIKLSGTALLAVERERAPLAWAMTQTNLGNALLKLGERESGTARLEEAVAAYRLALEEQTRERVPLNWASTQSHLGLALWALGEREQRVDRLKEAAAAIDACLTVTETTGPEEWVHRMRSNRDKIRAEITRREKNSTVSEV